ncbi:MAG: alpha/beta fold hydrolase [Armatimonadetes bacterium]|nr:alpha/beta fold hydrolase [Armatimonadota bacterium]
MAADVLEPGQIQVRHYTGPDGAAQPYRVYLPRRWRRRYPVLVCLHGFGGRMNGFNEHARRGADLLGWILLAPDGRGNNHFDGPAEEDVFLALDHLALSAPLDPERIHLTGGSMGGHGALRLALRHLHRFASVAAVAGWLSAAQLYPKWYAAAGEPEPHPAIRHLVEAASPAAWREHAGLLAGRLAFGTLDDVNEPEDTEWLIAWLRSRGWFGPGRWEAARVADGGHGAGASWDAVFRFCRRHRRRWPHRLLSLDLHHADTGWCRAERLDDPLRPAELRLDWRRGEAGLDVRNVAELTVRPSAGPPALGTPAVRVTLRHEGGARETVTVPRGDEVTVRLGSPAPPFAKRRGCDGPIGELFRDPFQVVAPERGPEREAAERLCADWNAWFVLRWSEGEVPAGREWWRRPYPLPPGAYLPLDIKLLTPVQPDEALDDVHLVLFGGPDDNPLARRFADWPGPLPFRPMPIGILAGDERLEGERIGYQALHPLPWRPERLALCCRGYQHSSIDPAEWGVACLGKDLESLPWRYPDLVVWDRELPMRTTVQPPLRHLPDAWLLAATLGPGWDWRGARVWRR